MKPDREFVQKVIDETLEGSKPWNCETCGKLTTLGETSIDLETLKINCEECDKAR